MAVQKTPVTILQELMMKNGETPEYEFISQVGPQHQAMFELKCVAHGETVYAMARSKKEAKQEVARLMLAALARRGLYTQECSVPLNPPPTGTTPPPQLDRSYVVLLNELCEEYRLPAPDYTLIDEAGPSHFRRFTFRANVGEHSRVATAPTKKAARQHAAEQLYMYLRENLRITRDFVEEDAMVRAHEKVMDRYLETREEQPWRPDFGQKISEYHLSLYYQCDENKRAMAFEAMKAPFPAEVLVQSCASSLGLTIEWLEIPPLFILSLTPTAPTLTFAGKTREQAAAHLLSYLNLALDPLPATT